MQKQAVLRWRRFLDAITKRNEPTLHKNNGEMGWHGLGVERETKAAKALAELDKATGAEPMQRKKQRNARFFHLLLPLLLLCVS